jgi:hypothetical protein
MYYLLRCAEAGILCSASRFATTEASTNDARSILMNPNVNR